MPSYNVVEQNTNRRAIVTRSAGGSLNAPARRFTIETGERVRSNQMRTVTETSAIPGVILTKVGSRVVEMNIIPFMRKKSVATIAEGLSGGTEMYGFFGGIPVSPFIQTADKYTINTATLSGSFGAAGNGIEEPEVVTFKESGVAVGEAKFLGIRDNEMLIVDAIPLGIPTSFNPASAATIHGKVSGASITSTSTHKHSSGLSQAAALGSVTLQASASSNTDFYGETASVTNPFRHVLHIIDGPAAGESSVIVDYNGTTKVANVSLNFSVSPGANARYRIGKMLTNDYGDFFGTFVIPSTNTVRFSTGSMVVRLADNATNINHKTTAVADALYQAKGTLETVSDLYESTRVWIPVRGSTTTENRTIVETTRRDEFVVQSSDGSHKVLATIANTIPISNNVTNDWNLTYGSDPGWPHAVPNIELIGGDIVGAEAVSTVNTTTNKIESITVTKPGLALTRAGTTLKAPTVKFLGTAAQTHSDNIAATTSVTIDQVLIAAMYTDLDFDAAAQKFALAASEGGWVDPIAQTFIINKRREPNGVFVHGVDVFFKEKPLARSGAGQRKGRLPVMMQIRPVVNGYPSSGMVLPFAVSRLRPSQISVSDNASAATTFVFRAPVYLKPGQEYAFVLLSNSNEYEVFLADSNEFQLDSLGVPDLKKPISGFRSYGGSFFKSQNGTTWSADQDKDLKFRIRRCDFNVATGFAAFKTSSTPSTNTQFDLLNLNASTLLPPTTKLTFEYKGTKDSDGAAEAAFTPFEEAKDVAPAQRLQLTESVNHKFTVNAAFSTTTTDKKVSPAIDLTRLALTSVKHNISNGELLESGFSINAPGTLYVNGSSITISAPDTDNGNTASATITTDGGGKLTNVNLTSGGSGYYTTPLITAISGAGSGGTIIYNGETDASGGNLDARYMTRIVTLAEGFDASDLKVFLTAYKPEGTDVSVYYKVLAAEDYDAFDDKKWVLLFQETPSYVTSLGELDFREFLFGTSGSIQYDDGAGGSYDKFKSFAIKIGMLSNNPVVTPIIQDLRAIALDR